MWKIKWEKKKIFCSLLLAKRFDASLFHLLRRIPHFFHFPDPCWNTKAIAIKLKSRIMPKLQIYLSIKLRMIELCIIKKNRNNKREWALSTKRMIKKKSLCEYNSNNHIKFYDSGTSTISTYVFILCIIIIHYTHINFTSFINRDRHVILLLWVLLLLLLALLLKFIILFTFSWMKHIFIFLLFFVFLATSFFAVRKSVSVLFVIKTWHFVQRNEKTNNFLMRNKIFAIFPTFINVVFLRIQRENLNFLLPMH